MLTSMWFSGGIAISTSIAYRSSLVFYSVIASRSAQHGPTGHPRGIHARTVQHRQLFMSINYIVVTASLLYLELRFISLNSTIMTSKRLTRLALPKYRNQHQCHCLFKGANTNDIPKQLSLGPNSYTMRTYRPPLNHSQLINPSFI